MSRGMFGIRARMFGAFGLIALMTVISSAVSWFAYDRLSGSLNQLAGSAIPAITHASELTAKGSEIVTIAPTLLSAGSNRARKRIWDSLAANFAQTSVLIDDLDNFNIDAAQRRALKSRFDIVESRLRTLDMNVQKKFWFAGRIRERVEQLKWAHADFLDEIEPLIADARFNIVQALRRAAPAPSAASPDASGPDATVPGSGGLKASLNQQEVLLQVKSEVNLLVGLIFRAANAEDMAQLGAIRLFAGERASETSTALGHLAARPGNVALRQSAKAILALAEGETSLFALRRDALQLRRGNAAMLANTAKLVQDFRADANKMALAIKEDALGETARTGAITARAKTLLLWAALGTILIAISVVWFYVGRNLVGRVRRLSATMGRMAEGDFEAEVPMGGQDEISDMAAALEVFRTRITKTQNELVQAGKLAALGQMAAGIAHDLNQPLAAIKFQAHNARVLIDSGRPGAALENIGKMSDLSSRMAAKINHLKTLARKPSETVQDVDLRQTVSSALDLLHGRIQSMAVEIVQHLPEGDLYVRGGQNRLEQVLINIIGNALDAMQGAREKQLTITVARKGARTLIRIRDTGHGVGAEKMTRIFDPFFTTKEVGKGLGLGLSISYNIIKDFGGSMEVNSAGDGAEFTIILLTSGARTQQSEGR